MLFTKKTPRILVIGDLMVDHYIWGESTRISPEAPVQVIDVKSENNRLGGACNVANNLASLGANVDICGVVGQDSMGDWLVKALDGIGVDIQHVIRDTSRPTTQKSRFLLGNQQVLRVDREIKNDISKALQEKIFFDLECRICDYDAIVLSDYNKGVLSKELIQKFISLAKSENKPILCDPKGRDFTKYKGATLLTPNKKEAQIASDIEIVDQKTLQECAKKIKQECNLTVSLITLSEDGIGILDKNDEICIVPTSAREVFDVTGAGDTVIAALAFCLAQKIDIYEACKFANAAAAVVVSKVGSATANLTEIEKILNPIVESKTKVISLNVLMEILHHQRKKVVFTNGCFDILHRGHVQYLEQARALGDLLVVGLNTDASVKRLKGEGRPINSQEDRALVLSGLESVDYIVYFDEDTPYHLIERIQPDFLVKGADYKDKEIVGSEFAKEVVLMDYVENRSTTNLIKKIRG
ncbi:D-glycero-beta-D-manno-heptose-7-phosphate kinase [Helicobacter anatolicus]|uniref:D-glycero-beta-D-manno-heptose-7-phosphate kinase n=1 Tax=Helicobacter anatolicus TaxID=2905874 RepID=UPI001E4538E4|nr:D-glycero-beta-D-manno-heptose-7-phosphate kinase [Helicobacter anatolicus]MCE3037967.1 D-glycero-beta-D-manno-heptose-7-phosphate kinase [Helicobacter anatolicus]